jgi:DNA-directed RNA polymerase omega subunit
MRALKDPTAGLNSEAAVEAIGNRYDLVLIAARRVRELHRAMLFELKKIDTVLWLPHCWKLNKAKWAWTTC